MNALISLAGVLTLLLVAGGALALFQRRHFSLRWLLVAAALVALNDFLLTSGYLMIPGLLPGHWNWQGKILALAATLAVAALPAFGFNRSGMTLAQAPGWWKSALPIALVYMAFFVMLARLFPSGPANAETIAFQLTMPGFEEEPFYRGVLLLALDRAFTGRVRFLGVEWGWGALLSCALFGLAHAFGFSHGRFTFDAITMGLTALPSLLAVWLRLRTGSLVLPILLHNFGNSISLFI
ncbi:MAG: CPBP family intramembrane metalloprotease [Proteobacteria bacterium]|nr:CPBP family intramembrane metalloprotease [Pseudomonadota bacterium]